MDRLSEAATRRKIIGVLIRAAREKRDKSQQVCAIVIDRSPNAFQRIEVGDEDISLPELQTLAQFLNVPFAYFFNEKITLSESGDSSFPWDRPAEQQKRVGQQLRKARQRAGFVQKKLANRLGCSVRIISQYEQGKRPVAASHVARLIEELDLPLYQLLPDEQYQAWQMLNKLPEEVRRFCLDPDNLVYLQAAMQLQRITNEDLQQFVAVLTRVVDRISPGAEGADHAS